VWGVSHADLPQEEQRDALADGSTDIEQYD
jgi:hypothetical protein